MKAITTIQKGNNPKREWHLVDLSGKTLGRVATEIAALLTGKNKPTF
jgi:large subunit ribosomal protein L13